MTEVTPLLAGRPLAQPDVYDRFSNFQKRVILAAISLAGLIAPFASVCFIPCVPEVAKDLKTTSTIVNYTVGLYLVTVAVGGMIWAPYAGFYGRQPVYMISLPLICIGSLGALMSVSIFHLLVSRTVQAFGASCVLSIEAATVSDIYRLEERGTAVGIFFGVVMLGPALAPLVGGISATYASWRMTQLIILAMGLAAFIFIAIFLPETSHPGSRGIDQIEISGQSLGRTSHWVWLNPFRALALLRGPNVLFVDLAAAFTLLTDYVLLIPMSYTVGPRYGIKSPVLIGACFLTLGVGNMIGSPLAGRLSDRAVIRGRRRRGGKWVPEDRLIAALPGALLLVPLTVLVSGLTTQFIPEKTGLIINILCLFVNGIGVPIVLSPAATYNVDIFRARSTEAIAVNNAVRSAVCGIASAGVLPLIRTIGVAAANGVAATLGWLAFGLIWLTIRYGDRMRASIDVGYTYTSL